MKNDDDDDGSRKRFEKIYKHQVRYFSYIGGWGLPDGTPKDQQRLYELHYWHIFLFWFLLLDIMIFIHLAKNIDDISEVLNIIFMLATLIAVLVKYQTIKMKWKRFKALFQVIHSDIFAGKSPREEKLLQNALKMIENLQKGYITLSMTALFAVMIGNAFSKGLVLPINAYTPYNIENKWAFIWTYAYEFMSIAIGCFANIAFDTLCPGLLIFLKAQIQVLGERLSNISYDSYKGDNDKIREELKACMRLYGNIVKLLKDIEELFSLPSSVQVMCSILVLIANFYAMSLLSAANDYTGFIIVFCYQCCMLSQIFMICFFANEMTLSSLLLPWDLYGTDWMFWSKENRRLAFLMMHCLSVPLKLKSINRNYSFNLEAFTSIVNSSYSYFALLQRVNN